MNWSLVYWISEWVIRLVMLVYVPRQRSAAASRTWLLLIFLLPWPGLLFYLVVGRIHLPKHRLDSQRRAAEKTRLVQRQMRAAGGPRPVLPAAVSPLAALATRLGDFEPFGGISKFGGLLPVIARPPKGHGRIWCRSLGSLKCPWLDLRLAVSRFCGPRP